jgi:hypothetical protein
MTTSGERYEEELSKMAEWIVTHPPSISPEIVGSRLADAEMSLAPYLDRDARTAATRERAEARQWLRAEAEKRGYRTPDWMRPMQMQRQTYGQPREVGLAEGGDVVRTPRDVTAWIESNWKIVSGEGRPYIKIDYLNYQRFKTENNV